MSSVIIKGDTSGQIEIASPAVAGTNTQTLVAATGTLAPLIQATAQASTSGNTITFTGIPSWAKRVTLVLSGVSTTGTNAPVIRIGTSSGLENSGYFAQAGAITGTNNTLLTTATAGWQLYSTTATNTISAVLTIINIDGNTWVMSGTSTANTANVGITSGSKTLSGTLDRIAVLTADTFDAGTINILYE